MEARPRLPGFIKTRSNEPPGRSGPHALHSRLLLVQRKAFDSHRQLSDGTKSLHTPPLLLPHGPSPGSHIFAAPSPPSPDPPPAAPPFLSCSMKNTTVGEGPSRWLLSSHREKRIAILQAGPAEGKREEKGRFALLIGEERRQEKGGREGGQEGCWLGRAVQGHRGERQKAGQHRGRTDADGGGLGTLGPEVPCWR